jgi:hypothetical protein
LHLLFDLICFSLARHGLLDDCSGNSFAKKQKIFEIGDT